MGVLVAHRVANIALARLHREIRKGVNMVHEGVSNGGDETAELNWFEGAKRQMTDCVSEWNR